MVGAHRFTEITRLTFIRTLLNSVDADIDILAVDARKLGVDKRATQRLDDLMRELYQLSNSVGDISIEIPEIFVTLEHFSQCQTLSPGDRDYCSTLLNPEMLTQLSHLITEIERH